MSRMAVDITGLSDSQLHMAGYVRVSLNDEFDIIQNMHTQEEQMVEKNGVQRIFTDDVNELPILNAQHTPIIIGP